MTEQPYHKKARQTDYGNGSVKRLEIADQQVPWNNQTFFYRNGLIPCIQTKSDLVFFDLELQNYESFLKPPCFHIPKNPRSGILGQWQTCHQTACLG